MAWAIVGRVVVRVELRTIVIHVDGPVAIQILAHVCVGEEVVGVRGPRCGEFEPDVTVKLGKNLGVSTEIKGGCERRQAIMNVCAVARSAVQSGAWLLREPSTLGGVVVGRRLVRRSSRGSLCLSACHAVAG